MAAKTLFVHIGFPKCGSTSLQAALAQSPDVIYPFAGQHGGEHLAIPLKIKGVDEWTRQWFDEPWVDKQMPLLMEEIEKADKPVFVSSERLASLEHKQIETLKNLFAGWTVEIVVVTRKLPDFINSTWRHAVFRHDYHKSLQEFSDELGSFSFQNAIDYFAQYFPVHELDLYEADFENKFHALTGVGITLQRENVGAGTELAELLQRVHSLLGSTKFKERFPSEVKQEMLNAMQGKTMPEFDPFIVPIMALPSKSDPSDGTP